MVNINKLSATLLLIKWSLVSPRQGDILVSRPENGTTTLVAPYQFATVLACLNELLRPDGTLALHFDDALFPAAPFLLYRLKSCGFSGCKAVVTSRGILLTAIR